MTSVFKVQAPTLKKVIDLNSTGRYRSVYKVDNANILSSHEAHVHKIYIDKI